MTLPQAKLFLSDAVCGNMSLRMQGLFMGVAKTLSG